MRIKRTVIQTLDASAGRLLVSLLRSARPAGECELRRVLFIRPGGIGDAILLMPAIQTLKKMFPAVSIHILAEKRNAAVFADPAVDAVFHYDKPRELLSVMRRPYDVVIDTEQWHRLSAVVARLIKAPISVGFATNERKRLFTYAIPYSHDDYEMFSFSRLLQPFGDAPKTPESIPFLYLAPGSSKAADSILDRFGELPFVALFTGGSEKSKHWGAERFHTVAQRLSERGYAIVAIGGAHDAREGKNVLRGISNGINLAGSLSLQETAAVIKKASLLITGDSAVLHLGCAMGAKILALFGPSNERKWAPRAGCVVLNKRLDCSPCSEFGYTPRCPNDGACMKKIGVEEVIREAVKMLEA